MSKKSEHVMAVQRRDRRARALIVKWALAEGAMQHMRDTAGFDKYISKLEKWPALHLVPLSPMPKDDAQD